MGFLKKALGFVAAPQVASALIGTGSEYLAAQEAGREHSRNRTHADEMAVANNAMQKEFAQMGIRWRADDARAAGLHPLAALGATGASYTPSQWVGSPDNSRSEMIRGMGQSISRSINATSTPEEKLARTLQLKGLQLDNEIKLRELEAIGSPGVPMRSNSSLGRHLLGQNILNYGTGGSGGYVYEKPTEKSHASPGKPHQAAGEYTDFVFARTATGLHPVPSKEMQEAIEDKFIPESLWAARNYLAPTFSRKYRTVSKPSLREHPLPKGYDWEWKPSAGEWRPYKQKRGLWERFLD